MRKWTKIAAICLVAANHTAEARDDWYDPGLSLEGDVKVGAIQPGAATATMHVRMKAHEWSLSWSSPSGQCRATLILPPKDRKDDLYVSSAVVVVEAGGSAAEYRVEGDVSYDDFNSMKIEYDGVAATLLVGDAIAREVTEVPIGPGDVLASVPAGSVCRRMQLVQQIQAHGLPGGGDLIDSSLERLLTRVSASDDPNEGVWEYFGKEADAAKVTVGGRYVLATVANANGGYDIIYVAGAEENGGRWQPMMLKGRLRPTIFADDYDLEWMDAAGMSVAGDTYAKMSSDHSLLTYGFPDYGATLKFRRVPRADVIRKAGL